MEQSYKRQKFDVWADLTPEKQKAINTYAEPVSYTHLTLPTTERV